VYHCFSGPRQAAQLRERLPPRWQLDLRTGERLEEQAPPQISLAMQGQHPMMGGNLMHGSALAHALGTRPPIFTGPNQQASPPPSFLLSAVMEVELCLMTLQNIGMAMLAPVFTRGAEEHATCKCWSGGQLNPRLHVALHFSDIRRH